MPPWTPPMRDSQHLIGSLIPEPVAKVISEEERLDRISYAAELSEKAQTASDPVLKRSYSAIAKATLAAEPRAQTEARSRELLARAAAAPNPAHAEALRRQERQLRERNPVAPRRAKVAKGKKGGSGDDEEQVLVYTADGRPWGTVPRSKMNMITVAGMERGAEVAKSARPGKDRRTRGSR